MRGVNQLDGTMPRRLVAALIAVVVVAVAAALLSSQGGQPQADAGEMEAIAAVFAAAAQPTPPGKPTPAPAPAGSGEPIDCFLRIDGIAGGSTVAGHADEIDVLSWSWGVSTPTSGVGGGGASGAPVFEQLAIGIRQSVASPKLMLAVAQGEHIQDARLACREAGEGTTDFLIITLEDVVVTSYHSASEGDRPAGQVALDYRSIEYAYVAQRADGTFDEPVTVRWDRQTNTGG